MAGAASTKTGEIVQPMGVEPRVGSCQRCCRRWRLYCKLSPSLIVKETKTFPSVHRGECGEEWLGGPLWQEVWGRPHDPPDRVPSPGWRLSSPAVPCSLVPLPCTVCSLGGNST